MKSLLIAFVLVFGVSAQADEKVVTVETITTFTNNDVPVALTDCNYPQVVKDVFNNEKLTSSFNLTLCREVKTYQAEVIKSKKWYKWSTEVRPIAGSETYSYKFETQEKATAQTVNPNDTFQALTVLNTCKSVRSGYEAALKASAGQSKCK